MRQNCRESSTAGSSAAGITSSSPRSAFHKEWEEGGGVSGNGFKLLGVNSKHERAFQKTVSSWNLGPVSESGKEGHSRKDRKTCPQGKGSG